MIQAYIDAVENLIKAAKALDEDATVFGLAGSTNHPSVKCEVEDLTLRHWYDLRSALEDIKNLQR